MKVGIVGLSGSGKTTLFRALTRGAVRVDPHDTKAHVGVVSVPDERVDFLAADAKPKKVTHASIEFIDGAGRVGGDDGRASFSAGFFADVRQVEALMDVVRGFPSMAGEAPSPIQDLQTLLDELVLADLQLVENRMQRVEKQLHGVKKGTTTPATIETALLERLHKHLEQGQSLKTLELSTDDEKSICGYDLLTLKPLMAVLNIPEAQIGSPSDSTREFHAYCGEAGISVLDLCAEVEMQVAELEDEEEAEFLESLGIAEPARNVLIRECYRTLGLLSFFTVGDPEVRAWTLRAGSKAIDAAGAIHSDLARGFIRIEVANFDDVKPAGGWEAARKAGAAQLHGKDYEVKDGDVVYIRFKV